MAMNAWSGQRRGARVAVKDTKTHAERTVAVDAATVQALRKMRSRHVEDAVVCGLAYPVDAYLWRASPDGTTPRPPDRFSYDWTQIDKTVGDGAHVRLHDLRHFHGTMLVGAGVPLPSVRDRLGHSSVMVTDVYVDGRTEWDQRSAEIIGAVLDAESFLHTAEMIASL